jgi:hypothetical protein
MISSLGFHALSSSSLDVYVIIKPALHILFIYDEAIISSTAEDKRAV